MMALDMEPSTYATSDMRMTCSAKVDVFYSQILTHKDINLFIFAL